MKTITRLVWLCAGIGLLAATSASAQVAAPATEKLYFNVNVGGQLAKRTLKSSASVPVYDEVATLDAEQPVSAGVMFDIGAGYRIKGNIYVGVVITMYSDSANASYTAKVPNPVVFGLLKTTTGGETGLDRKEIGLDPHITWVKPITDKIDLALSGGGAFILINQRLINSFSIPAGTQAVIPHVDDESAIAKGGFAQVDFIYNVKARYGIGIFGRYAGGKADLPSAPKHNVGGGQVGGGIRMRF